MLSALIVLAVLVILAAAIVAVLLLGMRRRRQTQIELAADPGRGRRAGDESAKTEESADVARGRGANTGLNF
ncbi:MULTISPECIES: hypothetical protein [unclassified Frondihabitans]|uniref:hypothetical protein n=1 Tax=unclassified Frondihabitans TaxID=2626248 RepID=UPI0007015267|nr:MULTISPECIES: hypothetical protein [unclassified Frondihabitans]KQQ28234.1 hypothetical protein ASF54_05970 [Frondihabitans sp. Leaf304]RPE78816.1 hypothetical protein EDF37_1497 [Frondihabitans sp. PhB153]RPF09097.1 hypothetical protein EDF39_1499 [Frondihabitans sp. PhB161]